jgi:hypothetical protein
VTAAGEWLPEHMRRDRYAQCDSTCTVDCGACKGKGRPLTAGAIARSLANATQAYRAGLADLWRETTDPGPWDD